MPDRRVPPPFRAITNIKLPSHQLHYLDNGIPVYELNMGTQDILKLELIFDAGRWYEQKKLVARATSSLLKEGTTAKNSAKIAEIFDFYAGTLRFPSSLDHANIVLYCLNKHFDKLIPILSEILTAPTFPQFELDSYINRKKSSLAIELEKADVVAYREVTELIFGSDHPYGYNSSIAYYDALTREDLIQHFNQTYSAHNCKIVISGKINNDILKQLNQHLGQLEKRPTLVPNHVIKPAENRNLILKKERSLQSAIRVGRRLFTRKHPDFKKMYILSTLLGGYFGSRLMQNLREDKGYTYGVYAAMELMRHEGDFFIGVEVGNELTKPALKEIYHEFRRLRDEPVLDDELSMVKNYMLGAMLSALDGPFNAAEILKTIIVDDLSPDYFNDMEEVIQSITPQEIQELANKYLKEEDFYEVIVSS